MSARLLLLMVVVVAAAGRYCLLLAVGIVVMTAAARRLQAGGLVPTAAVAATRLCLPWLLTTAATRRCWKAPTALEYLSAADNWKGLTTTTPPLFRLNYKPNRITDKTVT